MLRARTILQQNGKKVFYNGLPIVRRLLANRTGSDSHNDNHIDSNSGEKQVFYNGLPIYGRRRLANRTDKNSDSQSVLDKLLCSFWGSFVFSIISIGLGSGLAIGIVIMLGY